jgi:hypothetical protein
VVTNFGLLRRRAEGWHLDCEELFGDKLTGAYFQDPVEVAVTGSGFFVRQDGICNWQPSEYTGDDWLASFALATAPVGDAGAAEPLLLGLYIDRSTSDSNVAAGALGQAPREVGTFSWELGLERMVAGGDPARVYVTGYSYPPRVWHVRSALLGPDIEFDDGSDLDRDGELSELRPLAVDPVDSGRLWLRAAVTTQDPDGLWLFDAATGSLQQVFTLERQEKLADIAFSGNRVFVAGRDSGVSAVYAAALDDLAFEKVATLDATLTCLEVDGKHWLACNSDFTRDSPFIVASSDDSGKSWTPQLELADLATMTSCGDVCGATTGWLYGLYGTQVGNPTTTGERDFDASALLPRSVSKTDAGADVARSSSENGSSKGCGCHLSGRRSPGGGAWFFLCLLPLFLCRRPRQAGVVR